MIGEFGQFGGTRTYFYQLLNFYLKYDFDIIVGMPDDRLDDSVMQSLPCPYVIIPACTPPAGFKFLFQRFPFNALLEWLCIRKVYLEQKPDLLIVSSGSPNKYLGYFLLPGKLLYILHSYPHFKNGQLAHSRYLKRLLFGLFLSNKKQILTVSEFAQKNIAKSLLLPSKHQLVKLIRNTAGAALDVQVGNHLDKIGKDKIKILTIGHVVWYKNPTLWLEVAKRVLANRSEEHIEFIWAGDGDQYIQCQKWVAENGLAHSIKFIGFQSNVAQLYLECEIYFQPSIVESQGLSVIEAMRYGLPCVVSNAGGLPESVLHEKTGYIVKADDTDEMVSRILQLVQKSSLREEFGRAGQDYYKHRFSEAMWEKNMESLQRKILASKSFEPTLGSYI